MSSRMLGVPRPFRSVGAVLGRGHVGLGAASALLLVVERSATLWLAYELLFESRFAAVAIGAALGVVYAARGALRGTMRAHAQERFHQAALDALLDGDVLRATPLEDEDAASGILEGVFFGSRLFTDLAPDLAGDVVASAGFAAWVVATQPLRTVLVGAVALSFAGLGVLLARRLSTSSEERAWNARVSIIDDLLAVVGGRLELVANGRDASFREEARVHLGRWRQALLRAERVAALTGRAPVLAGALGVVVILLAERSLRGVLAGEALADTALLAAVVPPFLGVARVAQEMLRARPHVRAMAEILGTDRASHESPTGASSPRVPARVEVRDVTFAYPERGGGAERAAIRELSFVWEPGEILVLSGPNGAGKSTTLRLLLGLAKPSAGTILVGGEDLAQKDGGAWRRRIAYLAQRPFFPERATVREAIHFLAPDASDEESCAALERVGVLRALSDHGAPLDVRVGKLSVGQRQRVALARVLVQDAPILVLDEPDVNLDAAGIRAVVEIVKGLAGEKMIAVVAHTDELVALPGTHVVLSASAPISGAVRAPRHVGTRG